METKSAIIRGTTPTIQFNFADIIVSNISDAVLVIKQNNLNVIEKQFSEATVGNANISWLLTQKETLTLGAKRKAYIMCDWKLVDGTRGRSIIKEIDVEDSGVNGEI